MGSVCAGQAPLVSIVTVTWNAPEWAERLYASLASRTPEPYELIVAKDGREAVDLALAERPDLILLDVVMPVMDGFEACKQLRAQEATRSTPIIMVTTRGEEEHMEVGFENGCTDYVTKPIDGLELLAKVRNCLAN